MSQTRRAEEGFGRRLKKDPRDSLGRAGDSKGGAWCRIIPYSQKPVRGFDEEKHEVMGTYTWALPPPLPMIGTVIAGADGKAMSSIPLSLSPR